MKTALESTRKAHIARLRKFPYPYSAAFTILSDRHGITDSKEFLAFHRFLNTHKDTPHGPGLDLEIGDTYWFYDDEEKFSYFKGYSRNLSDQATIIKEFIASGYIDCLHTYGDFTNHPFERKYAEWAAEEMANNNAGSTIWVNHGNKNNIQNINRGVSYHQGAQRDSVAYHMDLTLAAGVKYFWRHLTPFVGQDRPLTAGEFCSPEKFESREKTKFVTKRAIKYTLGKVDRLAGGQLGFYDRFADNHFIGQMTADDGSIVPEFKRYNYHPEGIWRGARVADLVYQIQPETLDLLVANEGYMVVYNHLEYGDFYAPEIVALLRPITERFRNGQLWVTTTYRMVRYNQLFHLLTWDEKVGADNTLEISISPEINDPVLGKETISASDLEGFSFVVPNKYTPRLLLGGETVAWECLQKGTTESIYGLPLKRLAYPDA